MTRYWTYFSLTVLATGWITLGLIAWAVFGPVKTFVVNNYSEETPVPVITKVVLPGETLKYELDYCKYTDVRPEVFRTLIDGQVITLASSIPVKILPRGCHVKELDNIVIPATINPGEYYLEVQAEYRVNFFRTERIKYRTEYFTVGSLPEAERDVRVIEREGQTIVVPVPVYKDAGREPQDPPDPRTSIDIDVQTRDERDSSPAPEPKPEPGVVDRVLNTLGI